MPNIPDASWRTDLYYNAKLLLGDDRVAWLDALNSINPLTRDANGSKIRLAALLAWLRESYRLGLISVDELHNMSSAIQRSGA